MKRMIVAVVVGLAGLILAVPPRRIRLCHKGFGKSGGLWSPSTCAA